MSKFLEPPPELIQEALEMVHRNDLANFSVTCKPIYALAKDSVEEDRYLRREYLKVFNQEDYDESNFVYLPDLLSAILPDPHIATYVEEMALFAWCDS